MSSAAGGAGAERDYDQDVIVLGGGSPRRALRGALRAGGLRVAVVERELGARRRDPAVPELLGGLRRGAAALRAASRG